MSKKKGKRSARPIVAGHLEKISSRIFDQNRSLITEMIKGRYGVYALYRREKLYYVGLATNLRSRINQHLKDRHKGKWTHFSLYILRKTDHLREIETLLLRIADPTGNYIRGKLKSSKDLRPELKVLLTEDFKRLIEDILGGKKAAPKQVKRKKTRRTAKVAERPLKDKFPGGKVIYANYKGNKYKAWVRTNGGIKFKGQMYDTPSAAGMAVIDKGAVNGWGGKRGDPRRGELVISI